MSINYDKYIYSKGTHYIANSGGDEKGGITGGKAGDQTGKEWQLRSWYNRPWSCVLRFPDPVVAYWIAASGIEGALNDNIGYDQWQRTTFWNALKLAGYRPKNITTKVEEDCSAGVSSCIKAVGYLLGNEKLKDVYSANNSSTTKADLKKAGFTVLTASKYTGGHAYLLPGDVLLYEGHHVAINVTLGSKTTGWTYPQVDTTDPKSSANPQQPAESDGTISKGDTGSDVKTLQKALKSLGYDIGSDGVDGDFGANTEKALKSFQKDHGLTQNGVYDKDTQDAMQKALGANVADPGTSYPTIVISDCKQANIRSGPGTEYASIGVVNSGDKFRLAEPGEWKPVVYEGRVGWVSGKYGKQVTE